MSSHPVEVLCLDSDSDSDLPPPRVLPPKPPRPAPPLPRRRVEPPASYQVAAPPRGGWAPGSQPQGAGWSSGDETRRDGPSAGGEGGGDGSARRASRNISDCAGQVSRAGVMELDLCDSSASDEEMEITPASAFRERLPSVSRPLPSARRESPTEVMIMEDSDSEKDEPPPANEIPTSSRRVTGPVKQVRAPSYSSDEMYIVEPAPIVPRAPPSSARRTQQPARRHSTDVPVVPEPARVPSPIVARNAVASSSVSKAEAPHRVFKSRLPLEFLAEPLLPVPVAVASILDPVVPIPRVAHRQPSPPPSFSSSKLSASPPEHGLPLPRTSPVRSRREQLPEFQSLELSPSPSPEHLPSSPIRPGSLIALGQSKHLDLDDDVDAPYPYPPDSPIDSGPFEAQPPRFVCPDTWQFPLQPRKRARTPAEERNWPELASSVDRRDAPVAERDEDDSGDDLIVTRTAPSTFSRGKKGKGRQQVDLLGTDSMQTDDSSFFDSRDGSVRGGSDSESTPTSVQALAVPKVRNRRGKGRHKGKKTVAKSTSTTRRLRDPTGLYGTFWALAGVESEGRRRAASPELGEGSRYPRRLPIPLAVDIPTTPQEEIVEPCKQTHEEFTNEQKSLKSHQRQIAGPAFENEFDSSLQDTVNLRLAKDVRNGNLSLTSTHTELFKNMVYERMVEENAAPNRPTVDIIPPPNGEAPHSPIFEFFWTNRVVYMGGVVPEQAPGCSCEGNCGDPEWAGRCACRKRQEAACKARAGVNARSDHQGFAYDENGVLATEVLDHHEPIMECNSMCGCDSSCWNRVVGNRRGIDVEIFWTGKCGWGVRNPPQQLPTAENPNPRVARTIVTGTPLGIYAGELVDPDEQEERTKIYEQVGRNYNFDLDHWTIGEEVQKQEQVKLALAPVYARPLSTRTRKPRRRSDANGQLYYPDPDVKRSHKKKVIVEERVVEIEVDDDDGWEAEYCIDAFHYGNWTRFCNHVCEGFNTSARPVYVDEGCVTRPLHVFFAVRDIAPGEEITINYKTSEDPVCNPGELRQYRKKARRARKAALDAYKCYCRRELCTGTIFCNL